MNIHSATAPHPRRPRFLWSIPFLATFLPIVLLSFYTLRVASDSLEQALRLEQSSVLQNVSQFLTQDITRSAELAHAVASVPGTHAAVRSRDAYTTRARLKAIVIAYPEIDRAFFTDERGMLMSEYPRLQSASGAATPLFRDVVTMRRPAVSGVYVRPFDPSRKPVIAIAVPVEESGALLGALVFEYQATKIEQWLKNVRMSRSGFVFVLDYEGTLAAHPSGQGSGFNRAYATLAPVRSALQGRLHTARYRDPVAGLDMLATFLPITLGRNIWVIVAEQPLAEVLAPLRIVKRNIGLAGGSLTFLTLFLVIGLARIHTKNVALNRILAEKNEQLSETAAIVRSSNDAIIGLTPAGMIKNWNAAAEHIFQWSVSEIIGRPFTALADARCRSAVEESLGKAARNETVKHSETTGIRKDGSSVPVSLTVSPVCDEGGRILGSSVIARDITERRQIEQMKDDFISFVSHQLKAPVTAMRWTIETLLDGDYGVLPEAVQEPLKELQNINLQNIHLITDILNVSRIDRGVIAVDLQSTMLKEIAERAMRDYRVAAGKQGLTLALEGDGSIRVLADKEKCAESVANSISNALKHTEHGGITLRMYQKDGQGCIDVSDTGKGMPPEILLKLFTRDQILGGSAAPEKSAGLGLYIARNFMLIQKGDIRVQSTPGKGTTFTYSVPLVAE